VFESFAIFEYSHKTKICKKKMKDKTYNRMKMQIDKKEKKMKIEKVMFYLVMITPIVLEHF
jgi:uncharacterized protein YaaW (UPF0174 family)